MFKNIIKSIGSNTAFLVLAAVFFFYLVLRVPAGLDVLVGGSLLFIAIAALGWSLVLIFVRIARLAVAAFPYGDANGSTSLVVPAVYISASMVVSAAIIAGAIRGIGL